MISDRDMAEELAKWGRDDDNIRVVNLYSSRANPHAKVDLLSDYDVEVFVNDLEPFKRGEAWLDYFGEVMVREPYSSSVWEDDHVGPMVMFSDGRRIDFNIRVLVELKDEIKSGEAGSWNIVLVDKEGVSEDIKSLESHDESEFYTRRPTEAEYNKLAHHFWWNITYVAKYLYRDEFMFAKRMLDVSLHHSYLLTVLSWHLGVETSWTNNPGPHGRWIKMQLEPSTWRQVESTFAGPSAEDNWRAMFRTGEVFGRIASQVGDALGYVYPTRVEEQVTEYLKEVQRLAQRRERG